MYVNTSTLSDGDADGATLNFIECAFCTVAPISLLHLFSSLSHQRFEDVLHTATVHKETKAECVTSDRMFYVFNRG